jgi:AAA+ superfamily predicted ATPase
MTDFEEFWQTIMESAPEKLPARSMLKYEYLVHWARETWQEHNGDRSFVTVWASANCASHLARERVKPGRKLKDKVRYVGATELECPHITPISKFYMPGRKAVLTGSIGAFAFRFEAAGESFDVIFASAHYDNSCHYTASIALVPEEHLNAWHAFQEMCNRAANHLERSQSVYIIGGVNTSFKPNVEWDDVILSESLKADLRSDVETFFTEGVSIYQKLNLPPFRKLLLVGPPGTGKTTLTAAIAKLMLQKKCVVIYVSAADEDGATFDKIHQALEVVASSRHPVLLIVEELDVYLRNEDKSQILNVLDGLESPNNPRGALLLATTNFPEVIDERIAKRPGRVDRIVYIPPIVDDEQAIRMLKRYMGEQWQDDHAEIAPKLVGYTGAFVREVALYARMLAAAARKTEVSLENLEQSAYSLTNQLTTGDNLLPRKAMGFKGNGKVSAF